MLGILNGAGESNTTSIPVALAVQQRREMCEAITTVRASLITQSVKNLPAVQETRV